MNFKKQIAIISVYPPPFGGVSVHAKTLAEELFDKNMLSILITGGEKNDNDANYVKRISDRWIFHKKIFWYYKIPFNMNLYRNDLKIIHNHASLFLIPFLFLHRFIFGKIIVNTIHNQWVIENYTQLGFFSRVITNIFLKDKKTFWIGVNINACKQLIELGVNKERISVIPAYIPIKKKMVYASNDLQIKQTIKNFKKDEKLIGIYGFRFSLDTKGRDIYGFDFTIDVFKQLIKIRPNTKLVVLIPDASPFDQIERIVMKITDERLNEKILLILDNPIIDMSIFWDALDIYFRPTTDDGDSLAVREALARGVKVVASDVCLRPKGTMIYKSLDINNAVQYLDRGLNRTENREIIDENFFEKILDVYSKCNF